MCGRAGLSSDVSEIKFVFSIPPDRPTPNFPPSWNVAPTDTLPVVRYDTKAEERSLDMLRWGLIPYWAKDIKVGFANINAKAEGIESKPAFRDAFQRRRCLVPADNFYEWKKTATGKQPYALALADRGIMALAGVWENWHAPGGEWVRSFAIITTTPNELCGEIHNRMPVILKPETSSFTRRGISRVLLANSAASAEPASAPERGRRRLCRRGTAEIGAAFLCADLAITPEPRADQAAHIASWLDALKKRQARHLTLGHFVARRRFPSQASRPRGLVD